MTSVNSNQYDNYLLQILEKKKFQVSKELCDLLSEKFNVTNVYSRQIIKRVVAKNLVKSSSPMTFGKGQFVYFLPKQKLTKDVIKEIAKIYRPPLFRLIESLDINDGIISYYEALKITASPLERTTAKIDLLDDLIEILKNGDFVYLANDANDVKYILLQTVKESEDILIKSHFSKLLIDALFVKDIIDWLAKSNLILTLNNRFRNKANPSLGAVHNNLLWDAFGYTKATGLNPAIVNGAKTIEKQTLVVVDILLSRDYTQIDLDGFLSRVQINLNSVINGTRKIIPIVIYRSCTSFILNTLKSLGFLCYDIGSIYGSNIFSILENVSKLQLSQKFLENEDFEKTIEDTLQTIKESGQEVQLGALKGTLFEVMMYQVLKHQYPNADINANVYYSKYITNKETQEKEKKGFEYDYVIRSSHPKEIIVIELKGYHSAHQIALGTYDTKYTLKWFFNRTLPFIKDKYQVDIDNGYAFKAVYITSSMFEPEAIVHLLELNKGTFKPKKLDVFYDREKLLELIEENDFKSLKDIIDKYYL
ncbi:hypothetical protein ACMDB5_00875 [Flavobacterium sp. W1B]|uniref:hypothetical protein n=1 Tax=Flavobacterium sp. W1B TaxID=3394146 RepID=UPI0039BCB655